MIHFPSNLWGDKSVAWPNLAYLDSALALPDKNKATNFGVGDFAQGNL